MDVVDFVQLPRMTALAALAFAEQILSSADPHKAVLPPSCIAALDHLGIAQSVLAAALRSRLEPANGAELGPLDRAVDSAWGGLFEFVSAFLKLPQGGPLADNAALVQATLFADGLKFTLLPSTLEWAESQVRLEHMESPAMAAALTTLGAGTFVDAIRAAHTAYGKALGMGAAKTAPPPPTVRPAYLATLYAIRLYVVKVLALIEPSQPETKALVDALLLPLTTWNVRSGKRASADADPTTATDPDVATDPADAADPASPAVPADAAEPAADAEPASPASPPPPATEPAPPSSKPA